MVLFVLRKLILQTRMRSHPVGLGVWFLVGPFVYFHTPCVQTAKALARLRGCAASPEPSLVAYVISAIISWAGSNIFYSDATCQTEAKFPWNLLVLRKRPGHMTKMAIMHIFMYDKPFNILFWNQKAYYLEASTTAWGAVRPYKACTNDDTGLTLTFFMARSKSLNNVFSDIAKTAGPIKAKSHLESLLVAGKKVYSNY